MSDKELLELAAKAACIQIGAYAEQIDSYYSEWDGQSAYELTTGGYWNPLIDDGDALRLAVILDIHIEQNTTFKRACALYYADDSVLRTEVFEPWGDDKIAATRRAIVRAAAEIGKSMQP